MKATHSTLIALATAVSLLPVFVSLAQLRLSDYQENQHQIAGSVLADVSKMLSEWVREKRRMVENFAADHHGLLADTAHDPADEMLLGKLEAKIQQYFPDYFAYSVTTTGGEPLIDDFDGKVGEVCLSDVREFVATGEQLPRIHPNPLVYHFDLIGRWAVGDDDGLLLVSFNTQMLAGILKATQPAGHRLLLVLRDQDSLIEVTASGDRLVMPDRLDFRLSRQEHEQVLGESAIPDTRWHVLDLQQPQALADMRVRIYAQMASVYTLFLAVITLLWFFLHRYELQRRQLADRLAEQNRILEDENQLALRVYENITARNNEYIDNLRIHHAAKLTFSGDIYLSSGKDENRFYFLLADFTGHGLSAALGAIPLADVFFDCAKRQCDAGEMIRVCNEKLVEVLPTDRFCCALLLLWDKGENSMTIVNAGLPDAFLTGADNEVAHTFSSAMPPLGVTRMTDIETTTLPLERSGYLLGYTDGVIEAANGDNEMFGEKRLLACLGASAPGEPYGKIVDALAKFTGDARQVDDISLFQFSFRH